MVDRFFLWLGAGVVTAGLSAAMFAGSAVAFADDGSGTGGTSSASSASASPSSSSASGSAKSPGNKANSTRTESGTGTKRTGAKDDADDESKADDPPREEKPDPTGGADEPTTAEPTAPPHPQLDTDVGVRRVRHDPDAARLTTEQLDRPAAVMTRHDETVAVGKEAVGKAAVGKDAVGRDAVGKAAVEAIAEERAATAVEQDPAVEQEAAVAQDPAREAAVAGNVVVETAPETVAPEIPTGLKSAAVAFAAPPAADIDSAAAAPRAPTLINVIGTLIFNLYSLATRVVGGPPVVPPGSTVTVRQSTLQIDCGDGYVVPADWYFPAAGAEPPTRLIYLQHGFLAAGPWYSYTAAALAEQTNSIVVAPSLTSNFFACDACWLGAAPMQKAVANLFLDDNPALADSALAAGYAGPLPRRVVLVGHSLGGGLAAATAGYMVDNDTVDRLAGVVMLDGVGMNDAVPRALDKVPDDLPILQLAAPSYFWNQFGAASAALVAARPGRFVGVTLVGGSHVDAMQGGNPLIQFSQQLVAGFSPPQNVAAAQVLMVSWINDMFDPTQDGIDGPPGEAFTIDTPAGRATAVALPSSLSRPSLLDLLQPFVNLAMPLFTFEPICTAAVPGRCTASVAA